MQQGEELAVFRGLDLVERNAKLAQRVPDINFSGHNTNGAGQRARHAEHAVGVAGDGITT